MRAGTDALVVIVGGGVIGALTARELAKYECSVILLEKQNDVSMGTSKANSGIVHAGFDAEYGTNKAKFNLLGNLKMEKVCEELSVQFVRNGSIVVSFNNEQTERQQELYKQGIKNGVTGLSIISGDESRVLEPALSEDVKSALIAETGGIVCPYTLAINAAENAISNGVKIYRNCEVLKITKTGEIFNILTSNGTFTCKYIVNAAGVHADIIAELAGDCSFEIHPRRGEYMLFDKNMGNLVSRTIFQMPVKGIGKGVLVTPTADGNLLIGPNAMNLSRDKKEAYETTAMGQSEILESARKSIPGINMRGLITSFAGLRAVADTNDFIIGQSAVENLIHAAGMQSPGLSASPAIAEYIANTICGLEGGICKKQDYNPFFKPKMSRTVLKISEDELRMLVESNPSYANIICRCEAVPEGRIADAIRSECGASDIDGVKRRTRAGMGRCQGGFCMPKVLDILARETGVKHIEITKKGGSSFVLSHKR